MTLALKRLALKAWSRSGLAPGWLYRAIAECDFSRTRGLSYSARLPNGCFMDADLSDHVMRLAFFLGAYEPIESFLWTRLVKDGMVVIDAGANIGQYSLLSSTLVGTSGQVHSFEPIASNFERLRRNVEVNRLSNVRLSRAALWHESAVLNMELPEEMPHNAGSYRIAAAPPAEPALQTPGIRLDDYAAREGIKRLDLVKMDIEGCEYFAILGGRDMLSRFRPILFLEVNKQALLALGCTTSKLWQELKSLGYQAWRIGDSAQSSGPIPDFDGLTQSNILLHHGELPAAIVSGWRARDALQWARGGW